MATKQKILIVDDDNNIAELISLYLTKECYDTKIVNDGEAALVSYEHYNPTLILLALMLPGLDGYQVCREIRTRSNVPIIMPSGTLIAPSVKRLSTSPKAATCAPTHPKYERMMKTEHASSIFLP